MTDEVETHTQQEEPITKAQRQKLATYKWRQSHKEHYNKLQYKYIKQYRETSECARETERIYSLNYYQNNRENILQKKREYYLHKKQSSNNILNETTANETTAFNT